MAYPVRHFDPEMIYFITCRTIQSRFLMAPSDKTNELIGGILARAVKQCGVQLFAYVFTSNHFHLMVRAPSAIAMSQFMQRLQSNIAIKVGRSVDWRGRFFARRFSAEPVVDEDAQIDRLAYILSHGVKEGLVSQVKQWPGLSCVQALLDGGTATKQLWRDWTRRWQLEVGAEHIKIDRFANDCPSSEESLILTPLPRWASLSAEDRGRKVEELVATIDEAAPLKAAPQAAERVEQIIAQDPQHRPEKSNHAQRPKAHASTKERWIEAVIRYRAFLAGFRAAAREWLQGKFDVEFPLHCFRPPAWTVEARIV